MTVEMSAPAVGLTAYAAAEIRAYLGRHSISKAELARRLSENETWVGKRLNSRIDLTLTDLERIATALRTSPTTFLPSGGGEPTRRLRPDAQVAPTVRRIPLTPRVVAIAGQSLDRPNRPVHTRSVPRRAVRLRRDSSSNSVRPVTAVAR
jgi:transcriptional regulator with XRE-family HTH domain